jgi:uncharacterized protein (TIGR02145 family)
MFYLKKNSKRYAAGLCLSVLFLSMCTKTPDDYCGDGRQLNTHTEFCFGGEVHQKCGGSSYDPPTQFCHRNTVYTQCNTRLYDPDREFCAEDRVYAKCEGYEHAYNPQTHGCVNDLLKSRCGRNFFDPESEFCAEDDNRIYNLCNGQAFNPTQGCGGEVVQPKCGENNFDPADVFCSGNVIYDFCGGKDYDPVTQKCVDNEVIIIDNGGDDPVPITHTLTINVFPSGSGTVSRDPTNAVYADSSNVKITANAANGYRFVNWSGAGVTDIDSVTATVFMTASRTLTANFELISDDPPDSVTYTLTVNASPEACAVALTGGGSYDAGTSASISATAASNCTFNGWTGAAGITNASLASASVLMDGNKAVTANFTEIIPPASDTLVDDRDGRVYRTVTIGTQVWMAENLNFGGPASAPNSVGRCGFLNNTLDHSGGFCGTYGRLYDWSTAMELPFSCNSSSCANQVQSRHRGICPVGWHVPSDDEWEMLVNSAGGREIAGERLRSVTGWFDGDSQYVPGTDDFGFSTLPGGYGSSTGLFFHDGYHGYWWSATEDSADHAWHRRMNYNNSNVSRSANHRKGGSLFSLRCLRDD